MQIQQNYYEVEPTDVMEVVGASSQTIFKFMTSGIKIGTINPAPMDVYDYEQNRALLVSNSDWRERMAEMAILGGYWRVIAENWEEIESAYDINHTTCDKVILCLRFKYDIQQYPEHHSLIFLYEVYMHDTSNNLSFPKSFEEYLVCNQIFAPHFYPDFGRNIIRSNSKWKALIENGTFKPFQLEVDFQPLMQLTLVEKIRIKRLTVSQPKINEYIDVITNEVMRQIENNPFATEFKIHSLPNLNKSVAKYIIEQLDTYGIHMEYKILVNPETQVNDYCFIFTHAL